MGLNGMAVLFALRQAFPEIMVTETHPKVLYWHLFRKKYNYSRDAQTMRAVLTDMLGVEVQTRSEHEWDAVISAFVALKATEGSWSTDLHERSVLPEERLISPCGKTHYFWPDDE
jgi:predicted nuclease with RNAse H fold